MTTYAAPGTQPAPAYGPPSAAPPNYAGRPPVVPPQRRPRRRTGIVAAASALTIAVLAAAAAIITLTKPVTPAQHTIDVVPPPPKTYSSAEIQAAKNTACSAWDKAARSTALAGRATAAALESERNSQAPASAAALAVEKRVGASQVAYLRTQLGPATPPDVMSPINDWIAAQIDSLHWANVRDWTASNAANDRGNNLVDIIDRECGMS